MTSEGASAILGKTRLVLRQRKAPRSEKDVAGYPRITGWGKYIPRQVLTNDALARLVDTSDAWIRQRTGIQERRLASAEETASTMAVAAGRQALAGAGLAPQDLELVIAATCTGEHIFPTCASLTQHALGAPRAAAFDVNAACSGFVYALATAYQFIMAGTYANALVVGSEVYSRILDWKDRSTCVLFGDGAGAVVVEACAKPSGAVSFILGSDGSQAHILYVPGVCEALASSPPNGHYYLTMSGPEVFKAAVKVMVQACRDAIAKAGLAPSDISLFIPHQANLRIIEAAARNLGLAREKVFVNVERYGNTSSASIPIALCEAVEGGRLQAEDYLLMVGFGGGLSWGAMVIQWPGRKETEKGEDK